MPIIPQNYNLQDFANWATIITILFAVSTYWYDFFIKKRTKNRILKRLNIEFRTLYHSTRKDILKFGEVKTNNYTHGFKRKIYDYETLKWIIKSGNLTSFFKKSNQAGCIIAMHNTLKLIEQTSKEGLQRGNKTAINHFFEHRLFFLREDLLEISTLNSFFDMGVMPKTYIGGTPKIHISIIDIKKYKKTQKEESESMQIIAEHMPNKPFKKIPTQNFGAI